MSIRFLKLSLASPESIRSWTERILPNGKRVGKILKGDLIDYKNGLPIRDGLSCERIFGPMVSFTCTCGRFKCIETRGIHIVHDTLRSSRPILPDVSRQNSGLTVKPWGEVESSLQTSSKVKIDNSVTSRVSKNPMHKSIKKLVSNQKPSNKLKSVKPIESTILQPITYKQKKMLRFLSDFYYDYKSIYHSNKTETIPSFVSVFEEPISSRQKSVAKNFFKQQTVQYHSKKKQISKFLKHPDFSFKEIWSQPDLEYEYLFSPIGNKQMVGLKMHTSLIQNLLKPLYKFIFQIYIKFWFDLKIYSNNFIYEKHFFSWVSNRRKTQKMYDNFKVHPSFFSKFRIIGLYNKSQELPIIGRFFSSEAKIFGRLKNPGYFPTFVNLSQKDTRKPVISPKTEPWEETQINYCNIPNYNLLNFRHGDSFNDLNYKYPPCDPLNFLNLPEFLLISKQWPKNFFIKIVSSSIFLLQKRNPFFLANIETKKFPNNWYKVALLQDKSYINFLFKDSKFSYFKPTPFEENFLGFHCIPSNILWINNLQNKHIDFSDKNHNNQTSSWLKSATNLRPEVKTKRNKKFSPAARDGGGKQWGETRKKNTFLPLRRLKITFLKKTISLTKICIYWLQRNKNFQVGNSPVFSHLIPLKTETWPFFKTYQENPFLIKGLQKNPAARPLINNLNQKSSFGINLFEKESLSTQNITNFFSLLIRLRLSLKVNGFFPSFSDFAWRKITGQYRYLIEGTNQDKRINTIKNSERSLRSNHFPFRKITNTSFGSVKVKSFNLKPKNSNFFQVSELSSFLEQNRHGMKRQIKLESEKKWWNPKTISIFNFFKKQKLIQMLWLTPNSKLAPEFFIKNTDALTKLNLLIHSGSLHRFVLTTKKFPTSMALQSMKLQTKPNQTIDQYPNKLKSMERSQSLIKLSPNQEAFYPKDQVDLKADLIAPNKATTNHNEDISKSYLGSTTKQNIRVYKFKNFPPEEIRYCPYCEVELLPNSIRRYRLGYIEFVSPVTHIWYTASSIPLLLNLSKTMIEGIASCHEALSSGFPPVYKWSYNGETPTSWTFQMQPLKLPINLVPKAEFLDNCITKKLYYTEIIDESNSIICPNYKKPLVIYTPSFQIIPNKLISKTNFTMYKKRNKTFFLKNATTNHKEKNINKLKNHELLHDNSWFFLHRRIPLGSELEIKRPLNLSSNRILNAAVQPLKNRPMARFFRIKSTGFLNNISFGPLREMVRDKNETTKNISIKCIQDFSNLSFWKNIFYEFKDLWMFKDLSENFSLISKKNWFLPSLSETQITKPHSPFSSETRMGKECTRLIRPIFWSYYTPIYPSRKKNIIESQQTSTFHTEPFTSSFTLDEAIKKYPNKIMRRFSFLSKISPILSFKTEPWDKTVTEKKVDSPYDPFTATEYEKKREWLKLEGFFEDLSKPRSENKKLPDNSISNEAIEQDPHQEHLKSKNDTNDRENDSKYFDNLSLPLVLPFLGKNPDNIEFQSNYSSYEHLHKDPLKFIIDLYSTKHIWDSNNLDLNDNNESNQFGNYSKFSNTSLRKQEIPYSVKNVRRQADSHIDKSNKEFPERECKNEMPHTGSMPLWSKKNLDQNRKKFSRHFLPVHKTSIDGVRYAKGAKYKFFGITTRQINCGDNDIWNNACIYYNGPLTKLNNKFRSSSLYSNAIVYQKRKDGLPISSKLESFIKTPNLLKELESNFSLARKYSEKKKICSPFNHFDIINNNLFSKTHPFLPYSNKLLNELCLNESPFIDFRSNDLASLFLNKSKLDLSIYDSSINNVQKESNEQNHEISYNKDNNFRKLGRNTYYFKLEQMARLENAFLKNLFYRNKLYTTSIFKNCALMVPLTESSIFSVKASGCLVSENDNNNTYSTLLKTKKPGVTPQEKNQNLTIGKKTTCPLVSFLFGFHLNLCSFNFLRQLSFFDSCQKKHWSRRYYFGKTKYSWFHEIKTNRFFFSGQKNFLFTNSLTYCSFFEKQFYGCSYYQRIPFTPYIFFSTGQKVNILTKNHLKNSLWPLKSTIKSSYPKVYQNHFNGIFNEKIENLYRLWFNLENLFQVERPVWLEPNGASPVGVSKLLCEWTTKLAPPVISYLDKSKRGSYPLIVNNYFFNQSGFFLNNQKIQTKLFRPLKPIVDFDIFLSNRKKHTSYDETITSAMRRSDLLLVSPNAQNHLYLKANRNSLLYKKVTRSFINKTLPLFYYSRLPNIAQKSAFLWPGGWILNTETERLFLFRLHKAASALLFWIPNWLPEDFSFPWLGTYRIFIPQEVSFSGQRYMEDKWSPSLKYEFKKKESNPIHLRIALHSGSKFFLNSKIPIGKPISITYDFMISQCISASNKVFKNLPSLQTKQLEAKTLKSLDIKKNLKKWTQASPLYPQHSKIFGGPKNQNFPAVSVTRLVTKKPFKKTGHTAGAFLNFKKSCFPYKRNFAKNRRFSNLFLKNELSLRLMTDYQINNDILVGFNPKFFLPKIKISVPFFQSTWQYKPVFTKKDTLNKKSSLSYFRSSLKLANQIFSFSGKLIKTKQELSPLALLSFDTTQIEFFGSFKLYAKRKFLQISYLTNQTLPIVSLNISPNHTRLGVFVPKNPKCVKPWNESGLKTVIFFDEKNIMGAFVSNNKIFSLHKLKNNTNRNQKNRIRAFYNKAIKFFVCYSFFPVPSLVSFLQQSIYKPWGDSGSKPKFILPWKKLQPSLKTLTLIREKNHIFFPIMKLIKYWSMNNAKTFSELRLCKLMLEPKIITHEVTNQNENCINENFSRLQSNSKHFPIKRHKSMVCYAYAIETIRNKKSVSDLDQKSFVFENFFDRRYLSEKQPGNSVYHLVPPWKKDILQAKRPVWPEEPNEASPIDVSGRNIYAALPMVSHNLTDPLLFNTSLALRNGKPNFTKQLESSQSLSSKVSCFLYSGYNPLDSLNLSNKHIMKKKSGSSLSVGQSYISDKTGMALFRSLRVLFKSKRWKKTIQISKNKDAALSVISLQILNTSSVKELKKLCSAITKTWSPYQRKSGENKLSHSATPLFKSNRFSIKVKTKSKYDLEIPIINSQAYMPTFNLHTNDSKICSKVPFLKQTYFCFGNPTKEPKDLFLSTKENYGAAAKNQEEPLKFKFKPLNPKSRDQKQELISGKNLKTPIFKWGNRGHIFDKFSFLPIDISKRNTDKALDGVSSSRPEDLAHSSLGKERNDRQSLSKRWKNTQNNNYNNNALYPFTKTNHNNPSPSRTAGQRVGNNTYKKLNQKLAARPLLSNHTFRPMDQKPNHEASKANTNYYGCISQITSWGSDHGSWILFLKYIRANIYKNDQLLPLYFNKMNFQMMPRTGSIMLQQLLSQLTLVPKISDYDFEPNLVSKQNSASSIDTWPNFVTNGTKLNDINTHKSIKNTRYPTTSSGGENHFIKEKLSDSFGGQYFHYNSSFFFSQVSPAVSHLARGGEAQAKPLTNFNENFQILSLKYLSDHQSLINYKTFSILDGFVFLKRSRSGSKKLERLRKLTPNYLGFTCSYTTRRAMGWDPKINNVLSKSARLNCKPSKSKFFLMNTVTNSSNKYILYAYKIKKPVSYKRFNQTYQVNRQKLTTNWYRLNNLFSYTKTSVFLNKPKQKHSIGFNKPNICRQKSSWNTTKNGWILDKQIFSTTTKRNTYYNREFINLLPIRNQKTSRKKNLFDTSLKLSTIINHKTVRPHLCSYTTRSLSEVPKPKKTYKRLYSKSLSLDAYLDEYTSGISILINNDLRIIKLIYSLIISFQLQFLPVNLKSKQLNYKSKDYKKLFDTSFYNKPYKGLQSKLLSYYYLSLPMENSSLENIKQQAKFEFLKDPIKPSPLFKPKTEQFLNGKSAQLKNNYFPDLASSQKTPNISFYSSTQNGVDSNYNNNNKKYGENLMFSLNYNKNSPPPSRAGGQNFKSTKTDYQLVPTLSECGREDNSDCFKTKTVLAPQLNWTGWKEMCSNISWNQKSFYFPNQKVKIYNILISPLEIPTFRFLNFGFPTTPFDFTESELSVTLKPSLQNFQSLKAQALPIISLQAKRWDNIQKWSYIKQVNRSMTVFKKNNSIIGNNNFNKSDNSLRTLVEIVKEDTDRTADMILRNSQNKLTNKKHQNLSVAGFEPVLPINLETYKGQIQGETLFTKLKEIGKYNFLIKNKNTLFKSLILKMNSSLQPLLFKSSKANTICLDNQVKQTKTKDFLTIKVSNKQLKQWSNDLIFKKENPFPYSRRFASSLKLFRKSKQLVPSFFLPKKMMHFSALEEINQKPIKGTKMCEASKWNSTLDLEFFRTWLFLNSVESSSLDWFNNFQKISKVNYSFMNQKSILYNVCQAPPMLSHFISLKTKDTNSKTWENTQIGEVFHQDFFPKLLQFYEYRKNFLLKKNFKQRLSLTQSNNFPKASYYTYRFIEKPAIKCINSASSYGSSYGRENLIFGPGQSILAIRYLIMLSLYKNQFFHGHQNFHLYNQKNGTFKIWSATHKLLTRTVYQFYDQERDSKSFYEFKPFGPQASPVVSHSLPEDPLRPPGRKVGNDRWSLTKQWGERNPLVGIKHSSSYSNWKKIKESQIFDPSSAYLTEAIKRDNHKVMKNNKELSFKNQAWPLISHSLSEKVPQSWLRNTSLGMVNDTLRLTKQWGETQIKFRLLTVPQIFDLKDQFNNLNKRNDLKVQKHKIPINLLGPLFFSSQIRSDSNGLVFPFLRSSQNQFFKNSYTKINPDSEKFEYNSTYNETFLKRHRPLSSETLFREENLKVSASYKALLRKAKILEDYPDPDPLDSNLICLTLLNCGLPRPIWWNLQTSRLGQQLPFLPLFRDSYISNNKPKTRSDFHRDKNLETNSLTWIDSPNSYKTRIKLPSQFIWDGNQNQFKRWTNNVYPSIEPYMINKGSSGEETTNQAMAWKNLFSVRDWTKFENNTGKGSNDNSRLSFFTPISPIVPAQVLEDSRNNSLVSKTTRHFQQSNENTFSHSDNKNLTHFDRMDLSRFFQSEAMSQQRQENPEQKKKANNLSNNDTLLKEKDTSFFLPFRNSKSIKRSGTFNYGRNLRKLRLQYLRNFRRLRFIEYLKATYIKPEWMILSLLPVLPPDLRPVIANPRGYITGDINTHYQNVIYRNNNIEKLLDTFWIPRKFYSKISFYNYQKATNLMLSSKKSYLYFGDHSLINETKLGNSFFESKPEMNSSLEKKFKNSYALSKIFSQLTRLALSFSYENEIQKKAFKTNKLSLTISRSDYKKDKISKDTKWDQNNNLFSKIELNNGYIWQLERIISPMFLKFTVIPHFNFFVRGSGRPAALFYELSKDQKLNKAVAGKFNHQSNIVSKSNFYSTLRFKDFYNLEKKSSGDVYQPQGQFNSTVSNGRTAEGRTAGEKNQIDNYLFISGPKGGSKKFINNHTEERSKIKKSETGSEELALYNMHYKSLLKFYNHKSFFGSNTGIATGYNKLVKSYQFEVLDNKSRYDKNSKLSILSPNSADNFTSSLFDSKRNKMYDAMKEMAQVLPVVPNLPAQWGETPNYNTPSLPAKIVRTQALHDSKPLQEMQYSLQKAVDALIDNSQKLQSNVLLRKGRPLKSLSDNLKGKEGRFRQHLLGKRVDYSGRSVIVVGPDLKLYECGIPLIMALRLFQPFLILYLIYRFKIASLLATQLIQRKHPMVINLLKKFIETWPILLNRAPTLHRMNIQAFKIKLVQGKAILLHPLVCSSYNADFDGDQMGVHVPITQQARAESWKLLWSINNSIGLASRQPLFLPSQDMVIGNYYLTAPPIYKNQALPVSKALWPVNFDIQNHLISAWPENFEYGLVYKNTTRSNQLTRFPSLSRQWFSGFQKLDHYFFSLEEAYQYYLNQAYSFHVNTPVWFYFGMVFETSEREKPIEIILNKSGNSKIITKYYEKQLKRNRILGKNAFYFKSSTPKIEVNSLHELTNKNSINHPNQTFLSNSAYDFTSVNQKFSSNGVLFSNINKIIVLPSQTLFDKNLNPILLNQIIRSTFGRIEFYYEAIYISRSAGFLKTHTSS